MRVAVIDPLEKKDLLLKEFGLPIDSTTP